jgi:hypothetical protein
MFKTKKGEAAGDPRGGLLARSPADFVDCRDA